MKTCFMCGGEIRGRSVQIWTQSTSAPFAPSDAPTEWHDAHSGCAALLDDDDDEQDEEEEDDGHRRRDTDPGMDPRCDSRGAPPMTYNLSLSTQGL